MFSVATAAGGAGRCRSRLVVGHLPGRQDGREGPLPGIVGEWMGGAGGRAGAGGWVGQGVVLAAGGEAHGGVAAGRGAAAGGRLGRVERLLWGEHAALAGGGGGVRCIVEDVAQRGPVALGVRGRGGLVQQAAQAARAGVGGGRRGGAGAGGRGGDVAVPYRIVHHPAAATEAGREKNRSEKSQQHTARRLAQIKAAIYSAP